MANRKVRSIVTMGLGTASLVGAFGAALWWLNSMFFQAYNPGDTNMVPFIVERGWNLSTISEELSRRGITRNTWVLKILGKLKKKQLPVIRSGEYAFSPSMSPKEILQKFIKGELVFHSMTIPEGFTLEQVGDLMAKTTIVTFEEAQRVFNDRAILSQLKIPSSSFEGYVYPETYKFSRPDTAEIMVATMVKEGDKVRTKENLEQAKALGFTWHQVLILASIVEKESGNKDPEERRKISSVFHNRLRVNMPLQSDPTVIYGIHNFNGNLTKADLGTPSPYNTYIIDGLPPTPICNPGKDAIEAALFPADTDFLYFVSRGDGSSEFSAKYSAHKDAVKKFQVEPAKKDEVDIDSILENGKP